MHVDTGHNFPEVIEFRDRLVDELGERLIVASVQESIDKGRVVEETRSARVAQPAADDDAARRARGARLRRRVRRRPPRRGARSRQGARVLVPRRVRPVGPQAPAPRAVVAVQRADPQGRARARVPDLQLDRARRLAVHPRPRSSRSRRSTSRTRARCSAATGCCYAHSAHRPADRRRGAVPGIGALPHRRRHDLHRRRRARRRRRSRRSSPRSPRRGSPSAARPAPTTASPRRRWRTASARATSTWSPSTTRRRSAMTGAATNGHAVDGSHQRAAADRDRRLGRRRQVDADRPAAVRLQADPGRPARARDADVRAPRRRLPEPGAAHRRPARRARAGDHDRRRLPLLPDRRGASSSSPTPPATSSTRATWSRAPRPPTCRSCWSTRARASASRPAAIRTSPRCCGSRTWSCASTRWTSSSYDEAVFDRIVEDLTDLAARLDIPDIAFIPISALHGDNVVERSTEMSWYGGPPLLYHLEHVVIAPRPQPRRRALPGAVGGRGR